MSELNNKLPITNKKSYISKIKSYWILFDKDNKEIYKANRQNWVIKYVRKNWDNIE